MLKLGPLVLMSKKRQENYRELVNSAYKLHEEIWFDQFHDYSKLMPLDAEVAKDLAEIDPHDFDVPFRVFGALPTKN